LTVSVTAMAVPTFLIGVLPGYQSLGVLSRPAHPVASSGLWSAASAPRSFMVSARHPAARPDQRGILRQRHLRHDVGSAGRGALVMRPKRSTPGLAHSLPAQAPSGRGGLLPAARHRRGARQWTSHRLPVVEVVREHTPLLIRLMASRRSIPSASSSCSFIVTWLQRNGVPPARALAINTLSMMAQVLMMFAMACCPIVGRRPLGWLRPRSPSSPPCRCSG
jgi:hypothetical protein